MLNALAQPAVWQEFLEHKRTGGHMPPEELQSLMEFIDSKAYLPVVDTIAQGSSFAPPRKIRLSKMHSSKKRIVYAYGDDENRVLKLLTYLLQRKFDHLFASNLYSFRPRKGVRDAVKHLTHTPNIGQMWSYKVDISNYFNSIPVSQLLPMLRESLADEPEIFRFLQTLLNDPLVNDNGNWIPEEKGIMAGTPISTFLANLYLSQLDYHFANAGVVYARYSDDIIVFDTTQESLEQHIETIHTFLKDAGLAINPDKEYRSAPGQQWTFLGISYQGGVVDVAPVSIQKLKDKMRRKTRALVRWQAKKDATGVQAAKAFVRVFRKKLFENPVEHELTWVRWYFPLITTADSLKTIDEYSQNCIRYLATGTRTKRSYDFRYEDIKALGYQSLVNCYYTHRRE